MGSGTLKEGRRLTIRIIGIAIIAVALGTVGYAVYNIISSENSTRESLQEAEQLISDMEALGPSDDWVTDNPAIDTTQPNESAIAAPYESATAAPEQSGSVEATPGPQASGVIAPSQTANPGKPPRKTSMMGILVLDSLGGRKVPVINGATVSDLNRGAGHHPRTTLPGQKGNCVIFGHRNSVFRSFGQLKTGDMVRFEVPGKTYTYQITDMRIVNPDDSRIFAVYDKAMMTLVTCYPFNFIGSAPQRYIVICSLVG